MHPVALLRLALVALAVGAGVFVSAGRADEDVEPDVDVDVVEVQAEAIEDKAEAVEEEAADPIEKDAVESADVEIDVAQPAPAAGPRRTPYPASRPATSKPADNEAAEQIPLEEEKPKIDPEVIRLELMDGSGISGKLSVKEITVTTRYGDLNIPITEIKSFVPGLDSYPRVAESLQALIESLGAEEYSEREGAQKQLTKMGLPIRGELDRYARSSGDDNVERSRRLKAILIELEQMAENDDEPDASKKALWIHDDTVETTHFTVTGKISPKNFEISSKYGPLKIELADVRRGFRDLGVKEDFRKSLSVEGQHLVQRSFKNSNIRVDRGDRVTVTAEGTIMMTPWGNEMVSSPDGGENFGYYLPNISGGALVAKIGDSGKVFKVGSKHSFVADRAGILQFAVAMNAQYTRAHYQFPGKYNLKIHVQPK